MSDNNQYQPQQVQQAQQAPQVQYQQAQQAQQVQQPQYQQAPQQQYQQPQQQAQYQQRPQYQQQPQYQQAQYPQQPQNGVYEQKSKMVAGLLGIFLGGYGVHNFYLGNTQKAVIQVSVTGASILLSAISLGTLTFLTIPASMGMGIWGLIEGIMYLSGSWTVDGKGVPLKD